LAADESLATDLSGEASLRLELIGDIQTSNQSLETSIDNEASLRLELIGDIQTSNQSLETSIDNEASIRLAADTSLEYALSSEISRAEAAEDSLEIALSSEVSYLLANTDLSSIDSFAEVSDALAAQVSDFTAIYFKKASFSGAIDGTNADFTLADAVRSESETVYLNGLLQEAGVEYTVAGNVITFATSPSNGDKVVIYGVY
jgi:hypothetical protein